MESRYSVQKREKNSLIFFFEELVNMKTNAFDLKKNPAIYPVDAKTIHLNHRNSAG